MGSVSLCGFRLGSGQKYSVGSMFKDIGTLGSDWVQVFWGFRLGSGFAFWVQVGFKLGSGFALWVHVGFRLGSGFAFWVQVGFRLGSGLAFWVQVGFKLGSGLAFGVLVGFRFGFLGFRLGSSWVQLGFRFGFFGVQVGLRFGFWGSGWVQVLLSGLAVGVQVGFSYSICKNTAFPHHRYRNAASSCIEKPYILHRKLAYRIMSHYIILYTVLYCVDTGGNELAPWVHRCCFFGFSLGPGLAVWGLQVGFKLGSGFALWVQVGFKLGSGFAFGVQVGFRLGSGFAVWVQAGFSVWLQVSLVGFRLGSGCAGLAFGHGSGWVHSVGSGWDQVGLRIGV